MKKLDDLTEKERTSVVVYGGITVGLVLGIWVFLTVIKKFKK